MSSLICVLALLVGCSGGDGAAPTPTGPVAPSAVAPKPAGSAVDPTVDAAAATSVDLSPPPAAPMPVGLAQLLAAGHHADALSAARQAVQTTPTDTAAWRAYSLAAGASDQALAVLTELNNGQAVPADGPQQPAAYNLLRAELALAAGQPELAFQAAGLVAAGASAGLAAGVSDQGAGAQALALVAGAHLPRELSSLKPDAAVPQQALLRLVSARDAGQAAAWLDGAAAVTGWRADVARGQALVRLKMEEAALDAFARAAASDDSRGVVAADLGRGALLQDSGDHLQALVWAQEGAVAAASGGDVVGAARALELALTAGQSALDLDGPLKAAQAAADAGMAASGGVLAPELALALGRAGLIAGRPGQVVRPLWAATMSLGDGSSQHSSSKPSSSKPSSSKHIAALSGLTALAGLQSGLEVATKGAAVGAVGYPAAALATIVTGRTDFDLVLDGLLDVDAALLGSAAVSAHIDADARLSLLQRAAAAADRSGLPTLRLSSWLAVDSAARAAGQLRAAVAARAHIKDMVVDLSPALAAELGARESLAQFSSGSVPAKGSGTWAALLRASAPPADDAPLTAGVAAWASARALAAQSKGTEAGKLYLDALGQLPTHRYGRLSLGTVLDGSQGLPVRTDLDLGLNLDVEAAPIVALASHELLHRVADVPRQVKSGRDLAAGLTPAAASAAFEAAARGRAEVSRWLLGGEALSLDAVTQAEAGLKDQRAIQALLPSAGGDALEAARNDAGTALISIVVLGDRVNAAVLSGRGFASVDLGTVAQLKAVMSAHAQALRSHSPAAVTGNAVREFLLDPFTQELAGVPRYIVVGPAELQTFGLAVVPEQRDALRWLDDIRDVAVAPTLGTLLRPKLDLQRYRPDLLVLGEPALVDPTAAADQTPDKAAAKARDATKTAATKTAASQPANAQAAADQPAGADVAGPGSSGMPQEEPLMGEINVGSYAGLSTLPDDLAIAVRAYSRGSRQLVLGQDGTLAAWGQGISTARVIQISGVEVATGGGFVLGDGDVTLADIRSVPVQADLVVITAAADSEIQLQRAQAFLDAGARVVVIQAWAGTTPNLSRYLSSFYDALNQERPPIRAMEQGRLSVRNDPLRREDNSAAGVWGSWMLVGRP